MEAGTAKSVSWAHYTRAQGGVYCGRKARIKVSKTQPEGTNRYGEKPAQRPTGVETVTFEQYEPEWNPGTETTRVVHWVVESARHVWQVCSRGANLIRSAASRPWTCVNNCTQKQGDDEHCFKNIPSIHSSSAMSELTSISISAATSDCNSITAALSGP